MYQASRLLLMLSAASMLYCVAVLTVLTWPGSAWFIGLLAVAYFFQRRGAPLTTLGSARWAGELDLYRAGMLGANEGLILGRLPKGTYRWRGLAKLFASGISAKDACSGLLGPASRIKSQLVRLPRAVHTLVVAKTGSGKGVSCIIPFLLTCPDSCVVIDFKGENAIRTAKHRKKKFGHRTVIIDPFGLVTKQSDCFNPLDFISKASSTALDECNSLANAMVVRTAEEREPHWNDSAEGWISGMLGTVVQHAPGEDRSLQTMRELLCDPQHLETALKLMRETTDWDGMLARRGGQLAHCSEKERSSVLTTVDRHLRFLDTPAIAECTRRSTFDPTDLTKGKTDVYLVIPPEHIRPLAGFTRMAVGSMLRAVVKGGLQESRKVHFILDEAASLGHMDAIDDAIDKYRGYGVRLQLYVQSMGQLKKCFPEGQDQTLLSNCSQLFFDVNDVQTAEYVSARLGEYTAIVESWGSNTGSSTSWSQSTQPQHGGGTSAGSSRNSSQQARKLLKPEEVMALPPDTAITFTSNVAPVATTLLKYYREPWLSRREGMIGQAVAAVCTLIASVALFLCCGACAVALTSEVKGQPSVQGAASGLNNWLSTSFFR